MAWDTARTQQLLLDAAAREFSRVGLAGARVDRIAADAGVNKERIYQYFGKKHELFGVVLQRELHGLLDAVSVEGTGTKAVADYAGRVFDYHCEHPELSRLLMWEGLELGAPHALIERRATCQRKVKGMREALPELTDVQARDLLITIVTLSDGWHVLSNLDQLYFGDPDEQRRLQRRDAIVTAAEAIAERLSRQSV
ncbi:AcrR family transcriptional regulator [Diaminobutyricimonas aerilata]|uniref:AcrR family transcriptional regulator n=1 Tax=Diaminobutyricimonas aerilata TaxID=1162967 RepID=A0A2M9CI08_9MICO|nr:TetR family transcriptional regulator [Diaminobutyricimonas aerilata]PJJ71553.1 AcrR family transcriptional regulator [Diaminobutyricimonas aerilata]